MVDVKIEQSRKEQLSDEFDRPYFSDLVQFLRDERAKGKIIYPSGSHIFRAFDLTPRDDVCVIVLGQDPYHGMGQAHGLAFSVQEWVTLPPSLQNIYKELADDTGCKMPSSGDLSHRAEQWVLLLNTTLTVEAHRPLSHRDHGREDFTDAVIRCISDEKEGIIFLLWGSHAQSKRPLIDIGKHHILTAPHPSPLSAYRGRFGSKHFSKTNELLQKMGKETIVWC